MKSDKVYLEHIADCIEAIEDYTSDGKQLFFDSRLIQDAVVRNLEVIGEATKNISTETRQTYEGLC